LPWGPRRDTSAMDFSARTYPARSLKTLSIEDLVESTGAPHIFTFRISQDSSLSFPSGFIGVWWPISGQAKVICGDVVTSLDRRLILVSDAQRPLEITTSAKGHVVGFVAGAAQWGDLLRSVESGARKDAPVFPALHNAPRHVCRLLVRVLRSLDESGGTSTVPGGPAIALADAINQLQKAFHRLIDRCPGRNVQQKRLVFLRLQRVRRHLVANIHRGLNIRTLAFSANYSVWRFIRIYQAVFGETPYAEISRFRIERAKQLLRTADDSVGDIASAVGFESRAALTRALKKRFGANATQLRTNTTRP